MCVGEADEFIEFIQCGTEHILEISNTKFMSLPYFDESHCFCAKHYDGRKRIVIPSKRYRKEIK